MSYEHECEELVQAMIRENASLRDVLDTLRECWLAEWHNARERRMKEFNAAQEAARKL